MIPECLFIEADGTWTADEIAKGPFTGLQGGAVAALMCNNSHAQIDGDWHPGTVVTSFLRPVPPTDLELSTQLLHSGRRMCVLESSLHCHGKLHALQRTMFIRPDKLTLPLKQHEPNEVPGVDSVVTRSAPHGQPWMMDAMEVRQKHEHEFWFRLRTKISQSSAPGAGVLPAADWAHGLVPPMETTRRRSAAIPNTDLIVHTHREPVDDWIGIRLASSWNKTAIGIGWGEIVDREGLLGRVSMSIAISEVTPQ